MCLPLPWSQPVCAYPSPVQSEYKSVCGKNKDLKVKYEELQTKPQEQQAIQRQVCFTSPMDISRTVVCESICISQVAELEDVNQQLAGRLQQAQAAYEVSTQLWIVTYVHRDGSFGCRSF